MSAQRKLKWFPRLVLAVSALVAATGTDAGAVCEWLAVPDDGTDGPLSVPCLRCIAELSTRSRRADPFGISAGYWREAFDKPGGADADYQECIANAWCSARTVQHLNARKLPDCMALNPTLTVCETAMVLHTVGAVRCAEGLAAGERARLRACMHRQAVDWLKLA